MNYLSEVMIKINDNIDQWKYTNYFNEVIIKIN